MKNEEQQKVRAALRDVSMAMAPPAADAMTGRGYPTAMAWLIASKVVHAIHEKATDEELLAMVGEMNTPMLLLALTVIVGGQSEDDEAKDGDARELN
jgi:hypothetical protein